MSETETSPQDQKPRISRLAISSVVFLVLGIIVAGISLTVWTRMEGVVICLLLIVLSVISGIAALLMICISKKKVGGMKIAGLSIVGPLMLFLMLGPMINISKRLAIKMYTCTSHLSRLSREIYLYSEKNNGRYPEPEMWCDLLVEYTDVEKSSFICDNAQRRGDSGPCHYAINPNCGPNSPAETVLLFETKGAWNKYGGPELLALDNHRGKGVNVLFNGGWAMFIKREDLSTLKWNNNKDESSSIK